MYSTMIAMACIWSVNNLGATCIWHNVGMLFAWGILRQRWIALRTMPC